MILHSNQIGTYMDHPFGSFESSDSGPDSFLHREKNRKRNYFSAIIENTK